MPTLINSFLLIGPWPPALKEIGADVFSDLTRSIKQWDVKSIDVLGLSVTTLREKKFSQFYDQLKQLNPYLQLIVVIPKDYSISELVLLNRQFHFYSILYSFHGAETEKQLYSALEKAQSLKQEVNLEKLIQDQNQTQEQLFKDLEDRIEKRTRFLTESRRKLFLTNTRIEAFRKTLLSIHEANSLEDMEAFLNQSLNSSLGTAWIRVLFSPQDQFFQQQVSQKLEYNQLQIPLFSQNQRIGSVFFLRPVEMKFNKEETDYLTRISEAVALALDRIHKNQEQENIKQQWESTFNAYAEPVALIDENYDIVQANRVFHKNSSSSDKTLKCYQILFGRTSPCEGCQKGQDFRLSQKNKATIEVSSQFIHLEGENKVVAVNLYKDISDNLKMEKQIIERARLAELGTISSSIAHELNNPLGGILTYTQLLKMEMDSRDPLYEDIVEIEKGALRCKDIIQNMLVFTRNPEVDPIEELDLSDVLQRSFKIMELQTKSLGIEIKLIQALPSPKLVGHRNLLAQAFKNLMQISLDTIQAQQATQARRLSIQIINEADHVEVLIAPFVDQLKNLNSNQNYSWTLASQILKDQQGELEISTSTSRVFQAKISFPRPVLQS